MSDTRWSARADATKALVKGYDEINAAFEEIAEDIEQKSNTRQEARGLADYMKRLETGILTVLWHHILDRFHRNSEFLQSANQDLNTAVAIYESLMEFIHKLRTRFEDFEAQGKNLSECDHYTEEVRRVRQRNRRYDELGLANELPQTPSEKFRTGTFLVIIDSINSELQKRLAAYANIAAKFGFLRKLKDLTDVQVVECAENLQMAYPTDLEASLPDELLQFSSFLNTDFGKKSLDTTASTAITATSSITVNELSPDDVDVVTEEYDDVCSNVESPELRMYRLLVENNLETVFPNTAIVFRIYLCLMVSNCTGERSFSKLQLIKNHLRSSMTQRRLNSLTLLSVEHELLRNIDLASIINDFSILKSRRHILYKQ